MDIEIKNSEELEKAVNENKDLIFPDNNIHIEFQATESELNNIDCKNLFLCTFKNGGVDKRFDFRGVDMKLRGYGIMTDFEGRNCDGGRIVCENWKGVNASVWSCEAKKIYYFRSFIAKFFLRCCEIHGTDENSIHKCLNENIEFINEEDFKYGVYSHY